MRLAGLVFLVGYFSIGNAEAAPPISLQKPIACEIGKDCFIQHYPDRDPSSGYADYRCGIASFDGKQETSIRIPEQIALARGVAVVAAAHGVVIGVRDGIQDFEPGTYDKKKIAGVECGNGLVIQHADGWETQYCHLRNGSVSVKKGDTVEAGAFLGYVGQSGYTTFAMLDFSVLYNGKNVDPFAYRETSCNTQPGHSSSLWRAEDQDAFAYRGTSLINYGVTSAALDPNDIDRGVFAVPDSRSEALIFYIRAIHLKKGDEPVLIVKSPDGTNFVESRAGVLDRNKAQYLFYSGKKLKLDEWPTGQYNATYKLMRSGIEIYESKFSFVVASPGETSDK